MARKRHKAKEIVVKVRQVDVLTAQGRQIADAVRSIDAREARTLQSRCVVP
jgi:putative transposase